MSAEVPDIQQSLRDAIHTIAGITDQPVLEAEILLAHVLNQSRAFLHAWPEKQLSEDQHCQFADYIQRRCRHEPLAYITNHREFWSLDFLVSPDTLIPRPESELLVESVLNLMSAEEGLATTASVKVADLGAGSGAIGLSIAHERLSWQIYAVDISDAALQIAKMNAQRLRIENISFYQGSWCHALPCRDFDVIVSNPPYISEAEWGAYSKGLAFEPRSALVSGQDGLESIRDIIHAAKYFLKSKGYLLIEHGFLQAGAVYQLFVANGYNHIHSVRDLAGHERVMIGQYLP